MAINLIRRQFAQRCAHRCLFSTSSVHRRPEVEYDFDYLCNPKNTDYIKKLIENRKGVGNIDKVIELHKKWTGTADIEKKTIIKDDLDNEAFLIPNIASEHLWEYGDEPREIGSVNSKPEFFAKVQNFSELTIKNGMLVKGLENFTGSRSYILSGGLAQLEQALIKFTIKNLLRKKFSLISVPDILPERAIQNCGMNTRGETSQVYRVDDSRYPNMCLSGTSEIALANYLKLTKLELKELPIKLASVSRCYRAEARESQDSGIFRVHEFTKVEMFGATANETGEESHQLYQELIGIQRCMFEELGLHFKVLDMPLCELGSPAYEKVDMEAWMPGHDSYKEISSTSNCLEFQSRRLNLKYISSNGSERFAHTVNGTACAIPRTLTAICENNQLPNGSIAIPDALKPYLRGPARSTIAPGAAIPEHVDRFIRPSFGGAIVR